MASTAYEQILTVQGLDLKLRQLQHRHANHPARQELAATDAQLAEIDEVLAQVDDRHHDLERQRKRLEDEAASIKEKRADIDGKLYGGEITASKELLALQDEATMLLGKQTELEDQELEMMESLETIDAERSQTAANRSTLAQHRAELESALNEGLAEIDAEVVDVQARRKEAADSAEGPLLERYEALRDQFDGVAVARLVNGACDGCHIRLSAVAVDQMGKMADDAVVTCEGCGRMLVR